MNKTIGAFQISASHYNDIPKHILQGEKSILEFGCATGLNQLIGDNRSFFIDNNRAGRYLGIDLFQYDEKYLNIEYGDIRTFDTALEYDVVIALHVLEHIEFEEWKHVIPRLCSFVKEGGYLIIGTPDNEPDGMDNGHLVSNITPSTFKGFLADCEVLQIRNKYPFAEDGARFAWALLRYAKRWITRHPYVRPYSRLVVIWKRTDKILGRGKE